MSLPIVAFTTLSADLSWGICLAWLFRLVLGTAMLVCIGPNLYSIACSYFKPLSPEIRSQAPTKNTEEKLVAQQLRVCLAEGDHHGAFKLWQRAKSLEGVIAVRLVDVVHMLRALGKSHGEVVDELRSALDCNPSFGDSAAEMLDDLRRRGMLGLLGKIISLLNDMDIKCCKSPSKLSVSDGCSSDDDVSTQVARSECSAPSETSDDEEDTMLPASSQQLTPSHGQITISALLALRPPRGNPPVGHLHAARDDRHSANRSQVNGRWERLRADSDDSPASVQPVSDRSAPWRRTAQDAALVATTSCFVDGDYGLVQPVRANKPGSLSSSLVGSTALRPTRRL
jgi:hypothetical protein